jgi:pilus assembly protein CpaD
MAPMTAAAASHRHTPRARLVLTGALALLASACARHESTGLVNYAADVRERHPIVLRDSVKSLDVFTSRGGLDLRQSGDVSAFASEFKSYGRGAMVVEVPSGAGRDMAAREGMDSVRRSLSQSGVSANALRIGTYRADDPTMAAPIRLSFARLQAEVPHECGQWPFDLGISQWRQGLDNRSHWNFGCAYQSNLAAQIADPADLVRGRPEGRIDTVKRMNSIEKIRQGKDPSTEYRQDATKINQTVGAN